MLLEYVDNEDFAAEAGDLIELYNALIKDTRTRVNPLKYALLTIQCAREFADLDAAIKFLKEAEERLRGNQDAEFLCRIAQAQVKLQLGQHHDCLDILTSVRQSLEMLADVDPKVYAHLSKVFAAYYHRKEDYENFYKSSLQYLAYTPASEIKASEKRTLAIQLGMAILLGKNIYNIMELLDKEILQSLAGTEFEWLSALLNTLGRGQIQEFEQAINYHSDYIARFPNILKELDQLKQKVRIISLLELLFEVDKDDRSLKFDRISHHCRIEKGDVELMLMKAMSLQLIKGSIDEVEEVVHVDWILPRYLSKGHLEIMVKKLVEWEGKMDQVIRLVEGQSEELLSNL